MTPEFPRAPINSPFDKVFANKLRSSVHACIASFTPEVNVIDMFVPVSPSGTGKTFSASIASWRLLK